MLIERTSTLPHPVAIEQLSIKGYQFDSTVLSKTTIKAHEKMSDYETYDLGDFTLKSGEVIPSAKIAYKTFGDPSLPAIIYPTWYSGRKSCSAPSSLPILTPSSLPQLTSPKSSNLRQRMANRLLQNPQPIHLFHHHPRLIRKLSIILSIKHLSISLPQSNVLRQCSCPICFGHQTLAHHPCLCSTRLVNGRRTNLPMGNPIPRFYG